MKSSIKTTRAIEEYISKKVEQIEKELEVKKVVSVTTFKRHYEEDRIIEYMLMPDVAKALRKKKRHVTTHCAELGSSRPKKIYTII